MNIYCVIFMCSFGANSTDTEMPLNNSLVHGPNSSSTGGIGNRAATTLVDVASMILPERGEPVPQTGDIVMELPRIHNDKTPAASSSPVSEDVSSNSRASPPVGTLTLSDILLPPSAQQRNRVDSK